MTDHSSTDVFAGVQSSTLRIEHAPCAADNSRLVKDLREQSRHTEIKQAQIRIEHDFSLEVQLSRLEA